MVLPFLASLLELENLENCFINIMFTCLLFTKYYICIENDYSVTTKTLNDGADNINVTWDSRASHEDMDEMWNKSFVRKEWTKCGEKHGRVNISHDANKRPYVSRIEIRVR